MEEQNVEQLQEIECRPPELLYHYTNQTGLLGIFEKRCIWATHFRYLNDLNEGKEFAEALREHEKHKDVKDESALESIDRFRAWNARRNVFVTSFSENGNSLSQWRAYAGNAGGFCIGFEGVHLQKAAADFLSSRSEQFYSDKYPVFPCLYRDAETQELATKNLTQESSNDTLVQRICPDNLDHQVVKSSAFLKHLAFREEQEWRMILVQKNDATMKEIVFRTGSLTVTPYVKVPLELPEQGIGIKTIAVGPCPHPHEASCAVEILLKQANVSGVEVIDSQIPY
jgi:hypothetical protein